MEISISLDPSVNKNLEEYLPHMNGVLLSINEGRLSFHVDVMDGELVKRAAINPTEYEFITKTAMLPVDVHLMINKPQDRIEEFLKAPHFKFNKGVRSITFHVEAIPKFEALKLLKRIKNAGFKCGVAIDLDTYVEQDGTSDLIAKSDVVLLMSVKAGKSGQMFSMGGLKKAAHIRRINPAVRIVLDGGINESNVEMIKKAGVSTVAIGNYIYSAEDKRDAVLNLIRAV
jgi:ribulose-phosphate 3-epimerase